MSGARGGRLPGSIDAAMQRLNASVDVDRALWRDDIEGSRVHARGLARAGVISDDDARAIVNGLDRIADEIERGEMSWDPVKEDVHMNVEARLIELVGPVGGKLHTGRSRNDQVATDLRLYARRAADEIAEATRALAGAILDRAEEHVDVLMPAYTHLQRGQPSRLSHHLMAWQEMLWRDHGRIRDARARLNESPLGCGAVAGSGFPLDRAWTAEVLGFDQPMRNSVDATASRDFAIELAGALAVLGVHLSRIGEEIVLWSSQEFGFAELDDAFATSSSMMPQKKNPDVAELVRGKSARLVGHATSLLVLEKSLCFGYGRDLQEDKRPVFDAVDDALTSLRAMTGAVATVRFHGERMRAALDRGHLGATDLAEHLVREGVPFRDAHGVVGALVRTAEARDIDLRELPTDVLGDAHPSLAGASLAELLDPEACVERRGLLGGPARARVEAAIADARRRWREAERGS